MALHQGLIVNSPFQAAAQEDVGVRVEKQDDEEAARSSIGLPLQFIQLPLCYINSHTFVPLLELLHCPIYGTTRIWLYHHCKADCTVHLRFIRMLRF